MPEATITYQDLSKIRERFRDKTVVFCSGGFDMTHPGHVLFLEDCKKYGDILVVGVAGDVSRGMQRGNGRPVLDQNMRLKMVASLKPVDYVFITEHTPNGHYLDCLNSIFKALRPAVYVVNDDASDIPYRKSIIDGLGLGIKMVILKRWGRSEFQDISTTAIIEKIKKI